MYRRVIPWILLLLVVAIQPAETSVLPDGYRIERFAAGLDNPEAAALAPDGRIFVLEKVTGNVRVIEDGKLLTAPFVTVAVAADAGTSETGLLGIALHPDFSGNGWVYLYYTHNLGGEPPTSTNRIVRYTASGNTGIDPVVLLDNIGVGPNGEDNGGSLAFGADGKLYASVGVMEDDASADDLASLGGKILRMNPEDGSAPSDNPQIGLSHPYDLIWAWGLRNPASIAFHETAGTLYTTDNYDNEAGVDCDEINVVVDNLDYGWDTGACGTTGFPPAPMQTINPKNTPWGLATYSGDTYPGSCSVDASRECLTADDCKTCDGTTTPCNSDDACSTCSNIPTKECMTSSDCYGCADDGSVECTTYSDCWTCSKDPGVRCQSDDDCPSGGSKCDQYHDCVQYSCAPGSCLTNPCADPANYLFVAGQTTGVMRDVVTGVDKDQLESSTDFYTPTGSCPTTLTSLAKGGDGMIYATAAGTSPGLHRVVYDKAGPPRETSASPYAELTLGKDGSGLRFWWEDLNNDAWTCTVDRGYCSDSVLTYCTSDTDCVGTCVPRACPSGSTSTMYSLWSGTLASPFSYDHTVMVDTNGAASGDALVTHLESSMPSGDRYFLVSTRGANYQGTTGYRTGEIERPGATPADLCDTIGYGDIYSDYEVCVGTLSHDYADQNNKMWNMDDFRGRAVLISMMQYG
jgi:glucose/arabinose dehydrogenase